LDTSSLTGVSCPSTSLCVATDATGDVFTSTTPAAGVRTWIKTSIDESNRLTGVACPSTDLCVAVDNAGNLATSTDPAHNAWTVTNVEGTNPFIGVECPSTSVCAAATATDVLVSNSPSAGASAWTITRNADSATGPQCGKYGGTSGCSVTMLLLSCGSPNYCAAVDDNGGMLAGDPLMGTWTSSGGPGLMIEGLACRPDGSCLTLCGAGAGLAGEQCPGNQYDATDLCDGDSCFTITHQQASGLWCPSISLCFATDGGGGLIASTRPTAGTNAWTTVYLGHANTTYLAVSGLSCPSSTLCVAVNAGAQLLIGAPLPTTAQIKRLLAEQLAPPRPQTLFKRHGCSWSFSSPSAGRLTITWKLAGKRRAHPVIARGTATFHSSGTTKIKISLNPTGKRLLRGARSVRIAAAARVIGAGAPAITASRTFSLH
jgi:hypothetical protein